MTPNLQKAVACFHSLDDEWKFALRMATLKTHEISLRLDYDTLGDWRSWKAFCSAFSPQVALATEIPDYNQMTLPLGGSHTATAAQMRHFCRSYEFQLPTQPSSLSPPLPPPPTVQFSTLGPGGRHVYCNIPMTLLNGQVQHRKGQHFPRPPWFPVNFLFPCSCLELNIFTTSYWNTSFQIIQFLHKILKSIYSKKQQQPICWRLFESFLSKTALFSPGVQRSSLGNKRSVWIEENVASEKVLFLHSCNIHHLKDWDILHLSYVLQLFKGPIFLIVHSWQYVSLPPADKVPTN